VGQGNKKPKAAYIPSQQGKVPRVSENPDAFFDARPVWRMSRLDVDSERWGWNQVGGGDMHDIRQKLASYESMTFREIFRNDSTGCHHIEVYRLCPDARERMAKKYPGVEQLLSLRIMKKQRVWGIRTLEKVDLLWWDPLHEVYPLPN
jgi:hypothetical protein